MVLFQILALLACLVVARLPASAPLVQTVADDWLAELQEIDDELKRSEEAKNRYLAAARRHEDEGLQWQFQQNQKQEAKRAYEKADALREAAKMLQERIDTLNARRAELIKEHPEYTTP